MAQVAVILGIVSAVLTLLPKLIRAVETLFGSQAGNGSSKKTAVLTFLEMVWAGLKLGKVKEIREMDFEKQIKPLASDMIDDIVNLYNLVGLFKKD